MIGRVAMFLLLLVLVQSGQAKAENKPDRGFWWYETPPKEEAKKDKPETPQPTVPEYTTEELMTMDADKLKGYYETVTKEAVRLPTEENVTRSYRVLDVIRRKTRAFMNVSEMVWQKNPALTTARDNPITSPGRRAMTRVKGDERQQELAAARTRYALLYFRSDSCSFCEAQDQIMPYLVSRIGWQVKPIDIDANAQLATRLGVDTTPSLVLIRKGSQDFFPVTAGVASVEEIEQHLFRAVRLIEGATSPENFNLYDFQKGGGYDVQARQ